ncbi:hypothetical protein CFE70_007877 [Pyrenophora teres f. teres 0-1]|uniref:Uncharacterized protein n=1 Tax=Pyrenophora teres f. teres (strain 0-1) TaxID=861557 RepID=E3RQ91_PYRTT|nr:hypothetical protein PTT_10863 [Pyrenophora teres f. teres 0-1]KAK1918760.1 hypothetical protein P3342_010231 [Pyrenophora teres f. teres]
MYDFMYDRDNKSLNIERVRRTIHEYHIPQLPHARLLPGFAALARDLSKLEELRQEWRMLLGEMCGEDEFLAEMCGKNEFLAKIREEDEEFLAKMCGEDEDRLIEEMKRCGQELQQVNL